MARDCVDRVNYTERTELQQSHDQLQSTQKFDRLGRSIQHIMSRKIRVAGASNFRKYFCFYNRKFVNVSAYQLLKIKEKLWM